MSLGSLFLALALLLFSPAVPDDAKKKDDGGKQDSSKPEGEKEKDKDKAKTGAKGDDDEIIIIKQSKRKNTGRMGELSEQEEDKLDKIVNDFILHDIGSRSNPGSVKELESLGAEAIPAIVRGINKSAGYSHSCPVTVLSAKLIALIKQSEDSSVLSFIRVEVGAGVRTPRYAGLLNRVKAETTMRQSELSKRSKIAEKNRPKSPGEGAGKDSGKDSGKDPGKGP